MRSACDFAYSEDLPWDPGRNTAKSGKLLWGRKVIGLVNVAVLQSGLALGVEVGGRSSRVKLGVLARWVARGVNERGIQAYSLLRGMLATG